MTDLDGYRKFVVARMDRLRRTAYLLCGNWHTADDLVASALVKLFRHWRCVSIMDSPDGYLHRVLVRAWLDERRQTARALDAMRARMAPAGELREARWSS